MSRDRKRQTGAVTGTETAIGTGTGPLLHSDTVQTPSTAMALYAPSRRPKASFSRNWAVKVGTGLHWLTVSKHYEYQS